ncbi:type VI secretion system baseplate subunit TssE [Roseibium sp. RKSG952]|uniref:type VI secretion system baseplate subunit TssE n=1 Tax=Roseibium sp. RKSG952 TaxID=2529384 RepID=UPI0012BD5AB5|nr:type VI secretion system baseplate subunit TssE [Roseibium sp. RKSG952]MTI00412.1 type VI secretion system baseplate subunit TssE [Roseibium sp. RKSG952]
MVDRMLAERLQPSLLDRLTDDFPDDVTEAGSHRVIDINRLREIIQRDLAWLLNTANIASDHDLAPYPNIARSVINYGIPGLTGAVHTANRAAEIRQAIHEAIRNFEPRILPEALEVSINHEKTSSGSVIAFDISGELWAEPLPIEIYLRTALDVTTGQVTLNRQR